MKRHDERTLLSPQSKKGEMRGLGYKELPVKLATPSIIHNVVVFFVFVVFFPPRLLFFSVNYS